MNYLRKMLFTDASVNVNVQYTEHTSRFCHISRIRINLSNLVRINNGVQATGLELAEHLEHIDMLEYESSLDYSLIKRCMFKIEESPNKNINSNANSNKNANNKTEYSKKLLNLNQVYLFEIEQKLFSSSSTQDSRSASGSRERFVLQNEYLRIFIKECDINLVYTLFLYVVNVDSTGARSYVTDTSNIKKLILENFNCNLNIYVSLMLDLNIFLNFFFSRSSNYFFIR